MHGEIEPTLPVQPATETRIYPILPEREIPRRSTKVLASQLLEQASEQEWSFSTHQEFVNRLAKRVGVVVGRQVDFGTLDDSTAPAPDLSVFAPLPCTIEWEIFEQAEEPDEDSEDLPSPEAIAKAKSICGSCAAQAPCLELAYNARELGTTVVGGLLPAERQPEWQRRTTAKPAELQEFYDQLKDKLLSVVNSPQIDRTMIRGAVIASSKEFLPERPDKVFNERYGEIADILLDNPIIEERAFWVLPRLPATLAQIWMDVVEYGGDAVYDYRQIIRQSNLSWISVYSRLRKSEAHIIKTVTQLANGSFDYEEWHRLYVQYCPQTPLAFLARIGAPIPADADAQALLKFAWSKLDMFESGRVTRRAIPGQELISNYYGLDYYCLGKSKARSAEYLARIYQKSPNNIQQILLENINRLREILWRE